MTDQSQLIAAYQQAATDDLVLLQAFVTANGASFNALLNNLTTLSNTLNDPARSQAVLTIKVELAGSQGDFATLVSTTNAARTGIPNI